MLYILGIDLGTTGCKASLFDRQGQLCTQSYREYPGTNYVGTIDPETVWENVREIILDCNKDQPEIAAVCITSFAESVVLLDKDDHVLCNSHLYTTGGTDAEWQMLNDRVGEDTIYEITGHISHPMYTASRLLWYRLHHPEIYEKADTCLFFSSYIAHKLGAPCFIENTHAARSMLYDIKKNCWSDQMLDAAGISARLFAPIVPAGTITGEVSPAVCQELHFTKAPKIIAGGHDQPCVTLGLGGTQGGDAIYGLGTVECLSVVLDDFSQSQTMKQYHLVCAPHVIPGKYMTYGVMYSGGNVIKTLRDTLYRRESSSSTIYQTMFSGIATRETDLLLLPHLFGAGTPFMRGQEGAAVLGVRPDTDPQDILQATIEGLSFDARINIENMQECHIPVHRIRVAGGGAKSADSLLLRANALQKEFYLPEDIQAGARGVYFIAAHALHWITDYTMDTSIDTMQKITPDYTKEHYYQKKYRLYRQLQSLAAQWDSFLEKGGTLS